MGRGVEGGRDHAGLESHTPGSGLVSSWHRAPSPRRLQDDPEGPAGSGSAESACNRSPRQHRKRSGTFGQECNMKCEVQLMLLKWKRGQPARCRREEGVGEPLWGRLVQPGCSVRPRLRCPDGAPNPAVLGAAAGRFRDTPTRAQTRAPRSNCADPASQLPHLHNPGHAAWVRHPTRELSTRQAPPVPAQHTVGLRGWGDQLFSLWKGVS